ncbi:MAG: Ni/Fe-hydrogenase cytochrome b subunit [Dehalococcoidales bacterium]|nr:Ni/Fe-hydrogenase cytochrome b subunit [Dehalococcoidales bacterium]
MTDKIEKKHKLPWGLAILSALVLTGLVPAILRYLFGFGAMSNLSDGRGWGFWISFDLYCGVALAAGGFTLAAIVYVFKLEKYHSVARPAILTAFLGYLLVILALMVDLGQPWFIWHIFTSPNIHSPLFEVGICVVTYTIVLALEFSPALWERLKWNVPLKIIRTIQMPLVIAGICLSTLHQSSLGSMLLVNAVSVHPLWYTPILPILFFCSAIAVGPAMVMFESTLTGKAMQHKQNHEVMEGLSKIVRWVLVIYLVLKLGDLILRGDIGLIFTAYPQNLLWWGEIILFAILPIILFFNKNFIKSDGRLFFGATLVVVGLMFNRFNVSMLAMAIRPGYTYFPHWMEIALSAGLFADAFLIIWLANKVLPMGEHHEPAHTLPTK